jgi:hypothetical protein
VSTGATGLLQENPTFAFLTVSYVIEKSSKLLRTVLEQLTRKVDRLKKSTLIKETSIDYESIPWTVRFKNRSNQLH